MALTRSLNLRNATMLVVGNVVGAGIFTTAGFLAQKLDHPAQFMAVWLLGGVLSLCGAFTYAELGAMFPRAGGDYQYLKEAYAPWVGFSLGWLNFWIIGPGSTAALSMALVSYMPESLAGGAGGAKVAAISLVAALVALNYFSTKLASWTQDFTTMASIAVLAALVIGGAASGNGTMGHFKPQPIELGSLVALPGSAMIAVVFTYSGWFAAAYLGSEIKRPGRNVPLSLLLGTGIVTVIYTAVNGIYLYAVPLAQMDGITNIAALAAQRLFGTEIRLAVAGAIMLTIASCINANIMTGARICFAMAQDGLFPQTFGKIHPRFATPHVAVVAQGVLAVGLIAFSTFDALLGYVVFAMVLSSVATAAGAIVLRYRQPDTERPYRTFGYPVVPLIFIVAYVWIAASIAVSDWATALIGLGLALSGVPFFAVWQRYFTRV